MKIIKPLEKPSDWPNPFFQAFRSRVEGSRKLEITGCPLCAAGYQPSLVVPVRDPKTDEYLLWQMSRGMFERVFNGIEGFLDLAGKQIRVWVFKKDNGVLDIEVLLDEEKSNNGQGASAG